MKKKMQTVQLEHMRGAPVYDQNGDKIGTVEDIYYDGGSGRPEWIGLSAGFFGSKRVVVPVADASVDGDALVVPYNKDFVKDSPEIGNDNTWLDDNGRLYEYYAGGRKRGGTFSREEQTLTRSEEELQVGKQQTDAGRVRLRKWVETEPVSLDVELRQETARVIREDLNQPIARDDAAFREEEVEVPLHRERPVVGKQAVAKERVGIRKDVETKTERIDDEVRKERIDIDSDVD